MPVTDIEPRLIAFIGKEYGFANLKAASRFDVLVGDSLSMLELLQAVEKEFNKTIPDAEFTKLNTVGDLAALLERL